MGQRATGKWQHIAKAIETEIVFGQRMPREHLIEDDIMQRASASRHAVRRALEELRRLGLVVSEPNRGTRVRYYTVQEVEDLYKVREALEVQAALSAPTVWSAEMLQHLTLIQQHHEAASRAGQLVELFECNDEFHGIVYGSCGNRILLEAIRTYARQAHPIRSRTFPDAQRREQAVQDHWAMIEALRRGDRTGLSVLCRTHLSRPKDHYIELHRPVTVLQGSVGETA